MIALDLPRERKLVLGEKPLIMGVLNLTSDSFFPQSRIPDMTLLVERAKKNDRRRSGHFRRWS